jgi:excisionase family DNA binding protein
MGDGKKWHYEGFVSMFSAVRQALASLDDSISPDLPPFLLDPAIIAKQLGIPLPYFNWQGIRGSTEESSVRDQAGRDMLTCKEVAQVLKCSYSEARNRMLDGRIRAIKDGRWCRSRRQWVEEYVEKCTVQPETSQPQVPVILSKRANIASVKAGGVAHRFLQNRPN